MFISINKALQHLNEHARFQRQIKSVTKYDPNILKCIIKYDKNI